MGISFLVLFLLGCISVYMCVCGFANKIQLLAHKIDVQQHVIPGKSGGSNSSRSSSSSQCAFITHKPLSIDENFRVLPQKSFRCHIHNTSSTAFSTKSFLYMLRLLFKYVLTCCFAYCLAVFLFLARLSHSPLHSTKNLAFNCQQKQTAGFVGI